MSDVEIIHESNKFIEILVVISKYFSQYKLIDYIQLVFGLIVIGSSIYSASISKRIANGIKAFNDIKSYNKNRKVIAKNLKDCRIIFEDKSINIGLTNISRLQEAVLRITQYSALLTKKERKKMERLLQLIREEDYNDYKRIILLENINTFIARLEKGEIYYEFK